MLLAGLPTMQPSSGAAPGPGRSMFTLQTVPARLHGLEGDANGAARAGGFSLHAGLDIQPGQRAKLPARLLLKDGSRIPCSRRYRGAVVATC
jgi:hypothetical protein